MYKNMWAIHYKHILHILFLYKPDSKKVGTLYKL